MRCQARGLVGCRDLGAVGAKEHVSDVNEMGSPSHTLQLR